MRFRCVVPKIPVDGVTRRVPWARITMSVPVGQAVAVATAETPTTFQLISGLRCTLVCDTALSRSVGRHFPRQIRLISLVNLQPFGVVPLGNL
jgi:hypothetical protein